MPGTSSGPRRRSRRPNAPPTPFCSDPPGLKAGDRRRVPPLKVSRRSIRRTPQSHSSKPSSTRPARAAIPANRPRSSVRDAAAQALALRPGLRLLLTIVEQPPLSTDAGNQLNQTVEFCQSNAIHVLVLRGIGLGHPRSRRRSGRRATGGRPTQGLPFVESPLNALHSDVDDNAGDIYGFAPCDPDRAQSFGQDRLAGIQAGHAAWHFAEARSAPRRRSLQYAAGSVAGRPVYDGATVEDLIAGKSGGVRTPLRTDIGEAGFTVSDALMVRPLNRAAGMFGADQVLNYGRQCAVSRARSSLSRR